MEKSAETTLDIPDSTAVRVALWRALHVLIDSPPHVVDDLIGLQLVSPEPGWENRPDMHPQGTSRFRASIVARSRYVEDLVEEQIRKGVSQYVILGAGLDTFAQRRPDLAHHLQIYEVDKPSTQEWKKNRLVTLGFNQASHHHFVGVDFESKTSLWEELEKAGFDKSKPAIVSSLGVSMYLSREAIRETLQDMSGLAKGSKFIMTFLLPLDLVDEQDRIGYERSMKGAQASGTPFISLFSPKEMLELARDVGFQKLEHLSTASLAPKYFANREDGLRPSTGEELLICSKHL